jgi:hypothetical protein
VRFPRPVPWPPSLYWLAMSTNEVEAPVEGNTVVELQDWASLWADLLHVDMALHARDQLPNEAANLFARRALWEGAVVA